MGLSVKERFAKFDEVCRAIIRAGRALASIAAKALAPSVQPEIDPFLGAHVGSGENAYANHVAHGMAKLRAQQWSGAGLIAGSLDEGGGPNRCVSHVAFFPVQL